MEGDLILGIGSQYTSEQFRRLTADNGARRAEFDAMRKARQSGDTAAARQLMLEQRTKMDQQFAAHSAKTVVVPFAQAVSSTPLLLSYSSTGRWFGSAAIAPR